MSTFYDPGPIPGWPIGRPAGGKNGPGAAAGDNDDPGAVTGGSDAPGAAQGSNTGPGAAPGAVNNPGTPSLSTTRPSATSSTQAGARRVELALASTSTGPSPQRPPPTDRQAWIAERRQAEARVRALRDAVQTAAVRLQSGEPISLREFYTQLRTACATMQTGDLGTDGVTIGQQFEAFFERMRGLAEAHAEPVPTSALGLAADARFLNDMAEFLTSNYALDAEE